jgi:hypothetical protein
VRLKDQITIVVTRLRCSWGMFKSCGRMAKTVKGYDRRFSITSTHSKRASLKDGKYRVGTRMADISSVLLLARVFCGPVAEHLY